MKGYLVTELAHPSKISLSTNIPVPVPNPDEILVDVYSAGLNFFDILQTQGKYQIKPSLPFILGTEFAGRVSKGQKIPAGCPFKAGDRVFGATQGAFAEQTVARISQLMPLPDNVSYNEGAGLYITWPTSYEALVGRAQLKAGEWVLVTAAAGGVGIAAIQFAKALGARVIAAAGSDEKLQIAKDRAGADYTVNYSSPSWTKDVLKITGGKGVDVIYDPVGLIKDSLKCIAWKGRAVVVGFAAGTIEKIPMNLVLLKNISIVGIHWGAYTKNEPGRTPEVWRDVLNMLASGRIKPVNYTEVFTLETINDGLAALEGRKTWGKAIVQVRKETIEAKL
ncbi:alcohol dehydrogenase [Cylindrobasidium torrendii FP15055 ss-10]|uniref:Alcohol dehydrogenase n=1 Tax=Cylindrobasidium torrendii FP15055 ss-10 TaxID=1314674 RepID=A0A0D7BRH6_9AGAR|nr:alcohol dehydrogenase [Cylindrobasidium torrendii FP15055 ss-10]